MDKKSIFETWLEGFQEMYDGPILRSARPTGESDPFYLDLEMLEGGLGYNSRI